MAKLDPRDPRAIRTMINRYMATMRKSTARLAKVWKVNVGEYARQGWVLPERDAARLRDAYFTLLALELAAREARGNLEAKIMDMYDGEVLAYVRGDRPWTPEPDMTVKGDTK